MGALSVLESYLAWSQVHGRAREMLDRLTALAVKVELVAESAVAQRGRLGLAVEEIRAELERAALDAKAIVADTAGHIPTPGVACLGRSVLDALAALERFLRTREIEHEFPNIPDGIFVAIEPEILRATIAAAVDALLEAALPSERLRISHEAGGCLQRIRIALDTTSGSIHLPAAEGKLLGLRAWVELRGGRVLVRSERGSLSVELELPNAPGSAC